MQNLSTLIINNRNLLGNNFEKLGVFVDGQKVYLAHNKKKDGI